MTVLLLDLHNFSYRCRAGFTNDGSAFTYKFIRNLHALIRIIKPTSLVMVKEGSPTHRYELFPEYKGHRRVKKDDPEVEKKWREIMELKEQIDEAVNFCLKNFEITIIKHPKCEADDLIANVARSLAKEGKSCVVASNDKDFAQLLFEDQTGLIKVFNIGTKQYTEKPEQDPLVIKSLQGDKSDNIPGIPGYGPKKAEKLAAAIKNGTFNLEHLGQEHYEIYQRNHKLVKFLELDQNAWHYVEVARGKYDPAGLLIDFCMLNMNSLAEEKTYNRICETFGSLKQVVL
jgi:5'-3' exonuclease